MKKITAACLIILMTLSHGIVYAETEIQDNLKISGQDNAQQPHGITFSDGTAQTTSGTALVPSVYDNNGQYLGRQWVSNSGQLSLLLSPYGGW